MHCRRSDLNSASRQRGAALIVAMLVFAIATALVVAMAGDFDRFYQRTANQLLEEQAQAFLRAGEELASMALKADYDNDQTGEPRDDLTELWSPDPALPLPKYPLEGIGWLEGGLEDLQGRFNLNNLAVRVTGKPDPKTPTARFTIYQKQFIRLLQAVGEPDVDEQEAIAITEAVSDWLDSDNNPSQDGAEDDYYAGRTPAYHTGNRPMASASELRAVAHMTPKLYQALLPFVTALPGETTTLNVHTAPGMVLRSLNADDDLSPLSESDAGLLLEARGDTAENRQSNFKDLNDFFDTQVFKDKKKDDLRKLLGQRSSYFLLTANAEVAGRNMRLYSVLHRGNRRVDAIARANGSL